MLQRLPRFCKGVAVGSAIRSVNARFEHRQKLQTFFVLAVEKPEGQPLTYDFSVMTKNGVTTSSD